MKTVITSSGNSLTSEFDKRFGRGAWFCVYNEETGKSEFVENVNKDDNNGAGTKAAEKMVVLGVNKIISGDFGPKAKELLEEFNIQMVILRDEGLTVESIINKLK